MIWPTNIRWFFGNDICCTCHFSKVGKLLFLIFSLIMTNDPYSKFFLFLAWHVKSAQITNLEMNVSIFGKILKENVLRQTCTNKNNTITIAFRFGQWILCLFDMILLTNELQSKKLLFFILRMAWRRKEKWCLFNSCKKVYFNFLKRS